MVFCVSLPHDVITAVQGASPAAILKRSVAGDSESRNKLVPALPIILAPLAIGTCKQAKTRLRVSSRLPQRAGLNRNQFKILTHPASNRCTPRIAPNRIYETETGQKQIRRHHHLDDRALSSTCASSSPRGLAIAASRRISRSTAATSRPMASE